MTKSIHLRFAQPGIFEGPVLLDCRLAKHTTIENLQAGMLRSRLVVVDVKADAAKSAEAAEKAKADAKAAKVKADANLAAIEKAEAKAKVEQVEADAKAEQAEKKAAKAKAKAEE